MPGEVTAGLTFLNTIAEILFDPNKWDKMSRESKLKTIREGLDAAIDAGDWVATDKYLDMYRKLSEATG